FSKRYYPAYICPFTQWSPSPESRTHKRRDALDCRIGFCPRLRSRFSWSQSSLSGQRSVDHGRDKPLVSYKPNSGPKSARLRACVLPLASSLRPDALMSLLLQGGNDLVKTRNIGCANTTANAAFQSR